MLASSVSLEYALHVEEALRGIVGVRGTEVALSPWKKWFVGMGVEYEEVKDN